MADKLFNGKKALVTGGAKNMGKAISIELARLGADVAISFCNSENDARSTVEEIKRHGSFSVHLKADLRKRVETEKMVEEAADALGGLDFLVNNAGVFQSAKINEITEEMWENALGTNLTGPFYCARKAAEFMKQKGGGRIVNIASLGGIKAWQSSLPYCSSKAGLIMLTKCLALALAPDIQVNAIAPGMITFPPSYSDEQKETFIKKIPLKKKGSFHDVASVVTFLLSDSDFITGQIITVDGGQDLK